MDAVTQLAAPYRYCLRRDPHELLAKVIPVRIATPAWDSVVQKINDADEHITLALRTWPPATLKRPFRHRPRFKRRRAASGTFIPDCMMLKRWMCAEPQTRSLTPARRARPSPSSDQSCQSLQ